MAVANVAVTEFTTSAVFVWLLQTLKSASWFPWLKKNQAKVTRLWSVALAGLGAVGVSYTWTSMSGQQGVFIAWPGWIPIGIGLWHWLNQFAMQETIYQATANKTPQGGVTP